MKWERILQAFIKLKVEKRCHWNLFGQILEDTLGAIVLINSPLARWWFYPNMQISSECGLKKEPNPGNPPLADR